MGRQSNIYIKAKEDPTVIEVSREASEVIYKWLDKYHIDFDILIERIKSFTKTEIQKISIEDNHILVVYLTSGEIVFVEFFEDKKPKCKLYMKEDEYIFYLEEKRFLERFIQNAQELSFEVNVPLKSIIIRKDGTSIIIQFDHLTALMYNAIKKNIKKVKNLENIFELMYLIKKLPVEISSYDLSTVTEDVDGVTTYRISVINDRIIFYMLEENDGAVYQVDRDGSWKASFDNILFIYNIFDDKCKVDISCNKDRKKDYYIRCLKYVKDLTEILFDELMLINNTFEKMDNDSKSGDSNNRIKE